MWDGRKKENEREKNNNKRKKNKRTFVSVKKCNNSEIFL